MRVDSKSPTTPLTSAAPQRREAVGRRFSLSDPAGAGQAKAASSTAPLATLDAPLALDPVPPLPRRPAFRAASDETYLMDSRTRTSEKQRGWVSFKVTICASRGIDY